MKKIKCRKCGHKWETKSKLGIVICASCGTKNKTRIRKDMEGKKKVL